ADADADVDAPTAIGFTYADVDASSDVSVGDTVTLTFSEALSNDSSVAVKTYLESLTSVFGTTGVVVTTLDNTNFVVTLGDDIAGDGGTFDGSFTLASVIEIDADTVNVSDVNSNRATGTLTFTSN
ncbi:hypothetical protein, partial [Brevibacillus panacihumi]|uniref:hypothetical protein n=1 Tax=Brevibacillus panacihumi TaxID=497735 RepID=UPI003D1ACC0B